MELCRLIHFSAATCGKNGRCRICEGMYEVGSIEEDSCRHAGGETWQNTVCRHASAEN